MDVKTQPIIRTVDQLRAFLEQVGGEPADDERLIWFTCIGNAREVSESFNLKDMASMFQSGIEPINSLQDVQEYIDTFTQDQEPNADGIIVFALYLNAQVYKFCGEDDQADELEEYIEEQQDAQDDQDVEDE